MNIKETYNKLLKIVPKEKIKIQEPMKAHTSFGIGGKADLYVIADNIEEIKNILLLSKSEKIPLTVIGNGTNVLIKDSGIRGIVLKPNLKGIHINGNKLTIGSGELLIKASNACLNNELTGMEFACGIPGTIGGAIKMNAGAYGSEMKDIVLKTTYMDEKGELYTIDNSQHEFEYRKSFFSNRNYIIIESTLVLNQGNKREIEIKMEENKHNRIEKQPISMPSAGSTFKRGNGFITAKLIDECGLKGFTIGGAQVSEKHAGFIVNTGNATANNVLELVSVIREKVKQKFNVDIELEIQVMGE